MGENAAVSLMELDYKMLDGVKLATTRRMHQPGADGKLSPTSKLVRTLTYVKLDDEFRKQGFMLPN